ncbi:MAG: hypothetical protein P8M72_00350 [Gammaproteobacteria bacterium]|nr:hypothetical protein [Gammaproteobacteria bacterium]
MLKDPTYAGFSTGHREITRIYQMQMTFYPNDELRELACMEG